MRDKKWLANGNYFDTDLVVILNPDLELWIDTIIKNIGITRQTELVEQALNCVLANLYTNLQVDRPTRISLESKHWTKSNQPGVSWSSYNSISKILKELYKFGYIDFMKGYWIKEKNTGYQGKYWLEPDTKLIATLNKCTVRKIPDIHNVIILRDDDGVPVKYKERNREIKAMKRSLRIYNNNLNRAFLTYNLSLKSLYEAAPDKFEKRFEKIACLVNTGQITLSINDITIKRISFQNKFHTVNSRHSNNIIIYNTDKKTIQIYNINLQETSNNLIHQTHYTEILVELAGLSNDIRYINDTIISGEIINKSLFRVFNRGDLNFNLGGRFYTSAFQNLSKVVRNSFSINGEKTVSLDYSGMHIRMLYHLIGQGYQDECYVYHKGVNDFKRDRIKIASLIAINAKERHRAIYAILGELEDKDIPLPYNEVAGLLEQFEEFHKPIKDYFYSDIGIELQNKDSTIMNNILSILYGKGIVALPIHDEVIVPARHENFVREVMTNEYEKVMKYKPIID